MEFSCTKEIFSNRYISGGCGMKRFMDMKLLGENMIYDKETLMSMLKAAGIDTFFEKAVLLSDIWLGERKYAPPLCRTLRSMF